MKIKDLIWIAVIAILCYVFYIRIGDKNTTLDIMYASVEQLRIERDSLIKDIDTLKLQKRNVEILGALSEKRADSLEDHISNLPKNTPCQHRLALEIETKEAYKDALEKCKEAKTIGDRVTHGYAELVVNHEITCPQLVAIEAEECNQKGKFWKWVAGIGWVAFIIVLI